MYKKIIFTLLVLISSLSFAQNKTNTIAGKIFEQGTQKPMEYVTISVFNSSTNKLINGTSTDNNGIYKLALKNGTYNFKFDFMGYKTQIVNNIEINSNKDLDNIYLEPDSKEIEVIEVRAEKTTVELKLDKKVYNVGKDMIVRGGTLGDVLNNVPSVTVDTEGTVALRGNENVTILIDGKPSGLAGVNVADALKILPADAVDKVEVITNPSARYDAEGGGGIVNIVLKKGKVKGFNGSWILSGGIPETYGFTSSMNYKMKDVNLFANGGYNYRTNKGVTLINSRYLNADNSTRSYLDETRENKLLDESFNLNFGFDWNLTPSITWTNAITVRDGREFNPEFISQKYFDTNYNYVKTRQRNSDVFEDDSAIEYATNFTKKFKKDDHKWTIDFSTSSNRGFDETFISDFIVENLSTLKNEKTEYRQKNNRNLIQTDYVYPIGENGRFEAGYRGNFLNSNNNFAIIPSTEFTNETEYIENVNAFYLQYGNKIKSFSYFLGLRFEDSHIEINALNTNDFNTKKYNFFYPTATLNYELNDNSTLTLGYSRRVNRPRGRFINPISSYTSNINIIVGNPDLNPTNTDAIELGFMKKINKITLNTSAYINLTNDAFQFARRESGLFVDGIPVILASPINLAKETRTGFEFNINYNPFKWWRLNTNLNTFNSSVKGEYTYVDYLGNTIVQNFDNNAFSWFARLNSKITLPYKIDFQSNYFYEGEQKTAQGKRLSMSNLSLALSKDILKDNATIALNANDIFNSNKRRIDTFIDGSLESYSEFQRRRRTVLLTFTYRFNKQKNDRERAQRREMEEGGGDF